jgi:hypothetical protein
MAGQVLQHVPLPAEVLHELAGQLDRIPFDAVDAGHEQLVHFGQQVVQAMAELVEQRDHVVMGEQRGPRTAVGPGDRCREVAGQVGERKLHVAGDAAPRDGIVHPGAAALGRTCVEVEVEMTDRPAGGVGDLEEAHVRMPFRRIALGDGEPVDGLDHAEHAGQHLRLREVLLHFVVRERIAFGAQLLGDVGEVPGLQVVHAQPVCREGLQFRQVAQRERTGLGGKFAQELVTCCAESAILAASDSPAKSGKPSSFASSWRSARISPISGLLSHSGLPYSDARVT